ncbi:MAG: 16S rRNA (guanine(527)-N(7))-methyltransferase RsmG [Desulfobacterales bacterium]|nr:16S rRNA (guanine(527)-N(7))-methyltransferase RsmG [Desulfobacterales bacterium]
MKARMEFGSDQWHKLLKDGAGELGVELNRSVSDRFAVHAEELLRWNRKTNLTRITDPDEVAIKHFLDAITPFSFIPKEAFVLDIGTGGGFPGIPLKILLPSISVLLIDAAQKRVSFLKYIIRMLKLDNIDALHIRAESLNKEGRMPDGGFDVVICRALTALDKYVRLAIPLIAKRGRIIALKGSGAEKEIEDFQESMKKPEYEDFFKNTKYTLDVKKIYLPFIGDERNIVIIDFKCLY